MRDMYSQFYVEQSLEPLVRTTGTATGATIDLRGFDSAMCVATVGTTGETTLAAGTDIEFRVQESSNASDWTAVDDDNLVHSVTGRLGVEGTFALVDANSEDVAVYYTSYIGTKRYIRIVAVTTNCATGTSIGGIVIKGKPARSPASTI